MYNIFSYCCNYYAVSPRNNQIMIIFVYSSLVRSSLGCFILFVCLIQTKWLIKLKLSFLIFQGYFRMQYFPTNTVLLVKLKLIVRIYHLLGDD